MDMYDETNTQGSVRRCDMAYIMQITNIITQHE